MDQPEQVLAIPKSRKPGIRWQVSTPWDATPQSFYFAIIYIVIIPNAKNILEVQEYIASRVWPLFACSALPVVDGLRSELSATGLSPKMVQAAE